MKRHGKELLGPVIEATARGRKKLQDAGIGVIDGEYIDPLKMVILLNKTGADGNLIEQELLAANIDLEMANRDVIIPMITLADTPERIDDLVSRIIKSVERHRGPERPIVAAAAFSIEPEVVISPRDAFFSSYEVVAAKGAIGRVCAELICPYPPGVPVLSPGERITQAAFDALMEAKNSGTRIAFVADESLATIKVLPKLS
jgi:lysine decarboxylase